MDVRDLKGVGDKTAALFEKIGINCVEDLCTYYPRAYDVFREPEEITEIDEKTIGAVSAVLLSKPVVRKTRTLVIIIAEARDEKGNRFQLKWFNMPYIRNTLTLGEKKIFRGIVQSKNGMYTMEQPAVFTLQQYQEKLKQMQPVYGLTKGLTSRMVGKAVTQALEIFPGEEYLPDSIVKEHHLCSYPYALSNMHFPKNTDVFMEARRRLVFDEFFLFLTTLHRFKEETAATLNTHVITDFSVSDRMVEQLPYELTGAQLKVYGEIKQDLSGKTGMNRLIQGDVGSGKTIIAILALASVAASGYQGAFMAPTEVLAQQHYKGMLELFAQLGLEYTVVLLTGSMRAKEKREAYEKIESGEADIVIGTHALIQEKVNFKDLALVITDEQHRFGVKQRETLSNKGNEPHILVMSATPIPRTLAIILYGDLSVSVIDELPANRLPIKNCVIGAGDRPKAYAFIEKQVMQGRQAYVICPMVEESEGLEAENVVDYAKKLTDILPQNICVKYLHGKMRPSQKNEIMEEFAENQIQVLVSTTVVEVGVNVPNATVMMVENAERFGLAGLHQLRGRVGRGKHQSYCIFVSGSKKKESLDRLMILKKSNDGFYIAEEDLKLRGPGDLFGIRQSGDLQFQLGDVFQDASVVKEAAAASDRYECGQTDVTQEEKEKLERKLDSIMKSYLEKINL